MKVRLVSLLCHIYLVFTLGITSINQFHTSCQPFRPVPPSYHVTSQLDLLLPDLHQMHLYIFSSRFASDTRIFRRTLTDQKNLELMLDVHGERLMIGVSICNCVEQTIRKIRSWILVFRSSRSVSAANKTCTVLLYQYLLACQHLEEGQNLNRKVMAPSHFVLLKLTKLKQLFYHSRY